MTSFEDFCRSNILHVILKYHNEGGSRDVERLTRLAYDEYMNSPHLRHVEKYYLHELRFFPPNLTDQEKRHLDRHRIQPCYVDLGTDLDNWCMKAERYLLNKLKRNDEREGWVIAGDKAFLKNREIMILKYCRSKYAEIRRVEQEREKEEEQKKEKIFPRKSLAGPKSKTRKSTITDFFQGSVKSPRRAKMKRKKSCFDC